MPSRRSRGDGGLHWDEQRRRWVATASLGFDAAGKRVVKRGSRRPRPRRRLKLKEILRDYEDGLAIVPTDYTVAQAVTDWLDFGLSGRDPATVKTNRDLCERHVLPFLSNSQDLSMKIVKPRR